MYQSALPEQLSLIHIFTVGLCIANALTALSGAMVGQYQNTADINGGTGIVVIGLACLIIGETVLGRRGVARGVIATVIGSIIYLSLIHISREYGTYSKETGTESSRTAVCVYRDWDWISDD